MNEDAGFYSQPGRPDIQRMPTMACPVCGYQMDLVSQQGGPRRQCGIPESGDFQLCFNCAEPSIFLVSTFGIALRALSPQELAEFIVDHYDLARRLRASRDARA